MLTRFSLLGVILSALAVRLAVLMPQVHADVHHLQGGVYGAWGFNLAAFGRWDMVEHNIISATGAAARQLERLGDPAEVLDGRFVAQSAEKGRYRLVQPAAAGEEIKVTVAADGGSRDLRARRPGGQPGPRRLLRREVARTSARSRSPAARVRPPSAGTPPGWPPGEHCLAVNVFLADGQVYWYFQQPPRSYTLK